jgi:hypothetical protein
LLFHLFEIAILFYQVCEYRGQSQDEAKIEREEWRERVIQACAHEKGDKKLAWTAVFFQLFLI